MIKRLDNERLLEAARQVSDSLPHVKHTVEFDETPGKAPVLRFAPFAEMPFVKQAFSTRLGGVSKGIYASMNLGFNRGDDPADVSENFRRMAQAVGVSPERMVCSKQTHTSNIMKAESRHAGMGVTRPVSYDNIDALITNEPGLCLVTAYADCIPVIAADPAAGCIGAAHAGWRGIVSDIAGKMIKMMSDEYGSDPQNVTVFVGPGICQDCYEVSDDVADAFRNRYGNGKARLVLTPGKISGKWQLDLLMANFLNLHEAGVPGDHVHIADVCTCCNPDILYSHRASCGKRGVLCNFISIREDA